jgi:2-C-methyl-D-erythritol 4-phosphate cytidylyltransferase
MPKNKENPIVALITAGGCGKRLKHTVKKQFIMLQGKPLLFWTLDRFVDHPLIDRCVVVLPAAELDATKQAIALAYQDADICCVAGGAQRQDSVRLGLEACPSGTHLVLVHDGVRPFVTAEEITHLIEAARQYGAAIPVSSVKNTIKRVRDNWVEQTVERENLVEVYTPQVFDYAMLTELHARALADGVSCTDDAAILETYGKKIYVIETSDRNIKITRPFDLEIAELLLKKGSDI